MCFTRNVQLKFYGGFFNKLKNKSQAAEYEGGGSPKIEKFFFAFLDELDHLEAKKKNSKISGF